jgi:hypothetical protein
VRAARTKRHERGDVRVDQTELRRLSQQQKAVSPPPEAAHEPSKSREASGEIRVPSRRAPSIRPPIPEESGEIVIEADAPEPSGPVIIIDAAPPVDSGPVSAVPASRDSGPVITVEISEEAIERGLGEITAKTKPAPPSPTLESQPPPPPEPAQKPMPKRKRPAEPDPPELAARAGEVQLATGESIKKIDFDEPSIMISEEIERALRPLVEVAGEVAGRELKEPEHDPLEDNSTVVVREQIVNEKSEPVMLDRRRPSDAPTTFRSAAPNVEIEDEPSDVVVLETKKQPVKRVPQDTQVGVGAVTAATRARASQPPRDVHNDPTRFNTRAAPPGDYTSASDEDLAAPPSPYPHEDTEPYARQPAPLAHPGPSGQVRLDQVQRAPSHIEEDDDQKSRPTIVMSSIELDEVVPGRSSEASPAFDQNSDDGWGPPGSTIPPSLLGTIPMSESSGVIPIPDIDTAPLLIAPPRPPAGGGLGGNDGSITRALEEATAGVLDLIRTLDHTTDRDQVIAVLIAHLAQSHKRAGFFAVRGGELTLFAVMPRQAKINSAALRLDRPSTLQDVVGTRLPYRGPMLDEASRSFVATTLGAAPPELLLVPIAVRERVVGVLFGEHRVKHTFDDQLALAARAAGMALERILKAKRT